MKENDLVKTCLAVGLTFAFVLMISGNWHPSFNTQGFLWVVALCILVIVGFLLIFTEIGRGLLMVIAGGAVLYAVYTDNVPSWVGNSFIALLGAYFLWMLISASYIRVKATMLKYPNLKWLDLIKMSWSEREQAFRSDDYIKQHSNDENE